MARTIRPLGALFVLAVAAFGVASAYARQSLADVARQEEERRKAQQAATKVYTNKDLSSVPASATAEPAPAPAAAKPGDTKADKSDAKDAKAADAKGGDAAADASGKPKDQAYWSNRLKELQAQFDRDQTFLDALQSRVSALTADFTARDDPAQRTIIGRDRQKALDELGRLKQAIANDQKAIADLREEARRAGVPAGWLR